MPLYFFDTRDGDDFIEDDVGLELPDLERAKIVAAKSLAELARDASRQRQTHDAGRGSGRNRAPDDRQSGVRSGDTAGRIELHWAMQKGRTLSARPFRNLR